jgi:hypothetical protein
MSEIPTPPPREQQWKGQNAGFANVLISLVASLYFAQPGVRTWYFLIFLGVEVSAVLLYFWPTLISGKPAVSLLEAMGPGSVVQTQSPPAGRSSKRRLPWFSSLRVGAVVNFIAVIILIYATGGPIVSPFASVPLAMLIAGQILLRPGPIDPRPTRIILQMLHIYRFTLGLAFGAYIVLFSVDHYSRISGVHAAPRWEYFVVIAINLIYTTIITMITRAGDDPHRLNSAALGYEGGPARPT